MSDTPQGPGWWQATDGRWYAPELHPANVARTAQAPPHQWQPATAYQWQPQWPPTPAPKKKFYQQIWFWLLVVFGLLIGGCAAAVTVAGVVFNSANHNRHEVLFEISGSGTGDIIYTSSSTNSSGGKIEVNDEAIPWQKRITVTGLVSSYTLQYQSLSGPSEISCSIIVDGRTISSESSSGSTLYCSGASV